MSGPKVSLVVPTYNEALGLYELLDRVLAAMAGREVEVWVVDDDSPDGTWKKAEEYALRRPEVRVLRRQGERGLSSAVIAGFERATGPILAVMDADLSHDPRLLPRLADAVAQGAELAVGSRRVPGGGAEPWPWHRRRASDLATWLARLWLKTPIKDPMSGYFVLPRAVYERAKGRLKPKGYKILLEVACRARPRPIVELPYIFQDRRQGVSKLSGKVAWEYLRSLWELGLESRRPGGG